MKADPVLYGTGTVMDVVLALAFITRCPNAKLRVEAGWLTGMERGTERRSVLGVVGRRRVGVGTFREE